MRPLLLSLTCGRSASLHYAAGPQRQMARQASRSSSQGWSRGLTRVVSRSTQGGLVARRKEEKYQLALVNSEKTAATAPDPPREHEMRVLVRRTFALQAGRALL
eukprot:3979470-Prymnesium_polylepis.1